MIDTMKRFHERLREARKAAGFSSQEKFADAITMKRTQYLLYETGEKLPDPEITIPKIADGLSLPYAEVMAWRRLDGATDAEKEAIIIELAGEEHLQKLLLRQIEKRGLSIPPK